MERESNSMQALCRSGCGYYGNPATDGLCSLCYKEVLKKKQQPPNPAPTAAAVAQSVSVGHFVPSASNSSNSGVFGQNSHSVNIIDTAVSTIPVVCTSSSSSAASDHKDSDNEESNAASADTSINDTQDGKDDKGDKNKKKNRCGICRKKVGLTGFECRCGGLYCGVHRYSDKHDCSFDYREMGAQEIRRNNPVVVGEKIQKI